jgi:hypothetical protein
MRNFDAVARLLLVAGAFAAVGCTGSRNLADVDYDLVFTDVQPIEYARILCRGIPMEDRHTCMTSVIQHHHIASRRDADEQDVAEGPFVVVLEEDVYRGSYVSQPLAAAFTVSNGYNICRGRYSALAGDTEAIFRVRCDDGSRGDANIILDRSGRNGIGKLQLTDGTRGDIVFGRAAVGGAFL